MPTNSMLDSDNPNGESLETNQAAHRILDSDQVHSEEGFTREQIAAVAYDLWVERGSPHGSHEEDWHRAVEQLRERHGTLSQSAAV